MVELTDWIGRTNAVEDHIHAFPATALAATLDHDRAPFTNGDPLPPLWHWLYFLPIFKMSDTNYDGHAALGGFLPPVELPRRMWAGSRLTFHQGLQIGAQATKHSEILDVRQRTGRSGALVFVTVGHRLTQAGTCVLEEEHDIVYRAPPTEGQPTPTPRPAPKAAFGRKLTPSPVLLFRYSALTFNGHRIHYDQPFCTGSEGYEGLVVHGPLLATLMLDLLHREYPSAHVSRFEFRALAPVFDTTPFHVEGAEVDASTLRLWVRHENGTLAMEGTASIEHGSDGRGHDT